MSKDKVATLSVVVPAYNAASSIVKAVVSALSEIGDGDEVIVVDDGSTDGTAQMLAAVVTDPRLKIVRNRRQKGAAGARNMGIVVATGEYIAFLDADDIWLPGALNGRIDQMRMEGVLISAADAVVEVGGKTKRVRCEREFGAEDVALSRASLLTPTVIVQRDAAVAVGLFNERMPRSQDIEFFIRVLSRGNGIGAEVCAAAINWRVPRKVALPYVASLPQLLETLREVLSPRVSQVAAFQFICRGIGLCLREGYVHEGVRLARNALPRSPRAWTVGGAIHVLKGLIVATKNALVGRCVRT